MPSVPRHQSICYKKANKPRAFHKCTTQVKKHQKIVTCFVTSDINSILGNPDNNYGYFDEILIEGYIKGYVQRAKSGTLMKMQKTKYNTLASPCATHPDIWELRINVNNSLFRLYYSEDEKRNPEFVALAFQLKNTKGKTAQQIRKTQNKVIQDAKNRYNAYQSSKWGHFGTKCEYCI